MTEQTKHPAPRITAQVGGSGGPTYAYRGAVIGSNEKGTVLSFQMEGFSRRGWSGLDNIELIMRLVDSWLDTGKLPAPYLEREGT